MPPFLTSFRASTDAESIALRGKAAKGLCATRNPAFGPAAGFHLAPSLRCGLDGMTGILIENLS